MQKTDQQQRLRPRKRPGQKRSRLTVEVILEAAARILEAQNTPFTTNHIAVLAGVSIGSLYQYFPNSTAILAALIKRHVEEEVATATTILAANSGSPAATISALTLGFIDAHAARPHFTARLHSLAPSLGLDKMMNEMRDAQADAISFGLGLDRNATRMAVAAVEGALLRQLEVEPKRLQLPAFRELLTKIALAPFDLTFVSQ